MGIYIYIGSREDFEILKIILIFKNQNNMYFFCKCLYVKKIEKYIYKTHNVYL